MRAPSRSIRACRRAAAWCRPAPRSASMPPSRKAFRANITSALPTPTPIGQRSATISTASRTRRALRAAMPKWPLWRGRSWTRSAKNRSTIPTSRNASAPMTSARWRARLAICTRARRCGRTRAGACACAAPSSRPKRQGDECGRQPVARMSAAKSGRVVPRTKLSRISLRSWGLQISRLRCNFEWNALNLGVHRIAVDDELRDQRELTRRQLAGEIEGEGCIRRGYHLAREYCAAFAVGHEIATFGSRPLERVGRDRWQRPAHDVVAALMLLHEFDVPEQSDPFSVALDLGDESPARGGVSVI